MHNACVPSAALCSSRSRKRIEQLLEAVEVLVAEADSLHRDLKFGLAVDAACDFWCEVLVKSILNGDDLQFV